MATIDQLRADFISRGCNTVQANKVIHWLLDNWNDAPINKINAIRNIRSFSALGLKEAKDIYESVDFTIKPSADALEYEDLVQRVQKLTEDNKMLREHNSMLTADLNRMIGERNAYREMCYQLLHNNSER